MANFNEHALEMSIMELFKDCGSQDNLPCRSLAVSGQPRTYRSSRKDFLSHHTRDRMVHFLFQEP